MSEHARQWRLHVENRLEELRRKHGRELEDLPMPAWLTGDVDVHERRSAALPLNGLAPLRSDTVAKSSAPLSAAGGRPPVDERPKIDFSDLDL